MKPRHTVVVALLAATVGVAGCGSDDDAPEPPSGPNAAYLMRVDALCTDALDRRSLLQQPQLADDTADLARYLDQILEIQGQFRQSAARLQPPPALADEQAEALRVERALADTIERYKRAAGQGGDRFLEVVRGLQDAANPQIERLNAVFDRLGVSACEAEEIDQLEE